MVPGMALPEHGPWPHPYYQTPEERVEVAFRDGQGRDRRVLTFHKVTGSGPPLVLVHGLMTTSYSWRYVLGDLGKRYRVFAPDLVGAGSSDEPADLVYSVGNVAGFIAAYVRSLGVDRPYLVGNSLGGLYCLKALLDSPDLARRFVLMHSPGYPQARVRRGHAFLRLPLASRAVAGALHRFGSTFVARNIHYHRSDVLSREEVREYGRQFRTPAGARVFVRILRESFDPAEHAAIITELRRRREESGFPCPTLVLYARTDMLVPPEFGRRYAQDIPGSELRWVDHSSHFLQVDQPARTVQEILAFDRVS
jgi:pimeloyl-ACP methyl ester carboxylesterase